MAGAAILPAREPPDTFSPAPTSESVPARIVSGLRSAFDPRREGRIPVLDGVRAVAISLVMIAHLLPDSEAHLEAAAIGNTGVRLFFVLSGFLITHLLLREEARTGGVSLRGFYMRRAFRIFPACWFYVGVMMLLSAAGIRVLSGLTIWSSLFYFSNYVQWMNVDQPLRHLWSLSVEEQFYLVWPVMFLLLPRFRVRILALVILLAPLWRLAIFLHPEWHLYETIDRRFDAIADCIASGCLLAMIRNSDTYARLFGRKWIWIPAMFLLTGALVSTHPRLYFLVGQSAVNIGLALCLDCALRFQESPRFRWLGWTPLAIIGIISYSLYLWQQIFLMDSGGSFAPETRLLFAALAALGSFLFVERPMLRLRHFIAGRRGRIRREAIA